jgi:Domain of unknown function (DUF1707)
MPVVKSAPEGFPLVPRKCHGDARSRRYCEGCGSPTRAVSFLTLEPGTRVVDRFGRPVGNIECVLLHEDGAFDGVIVRTVAGRRFVDAPEVRRISHGAVTLGTTVGEVNCPAADGEHRQGAPAARYDRTEVTEADRDAAIDVLKRAYVKDDLSIEQLGERVAIAHVADTLDQLDGALNGLDVC